VDGVMVVPDSNNWLITLLPILVWLVCSLFIVQEDMHDWSGDWKAMLLAMAGDIIRV